MSVVNVFSFLFETKGADKVKKSISELDTELKDLEKRNGTLTKEEIKRYHTLKKQKEATDQLKTSSDSLAASVVKLTGVYIGFKKILSEVLGFASGGEDLLLMANNAGIGAEQLERYGIALQNYGGGLSSAASTLANLNQQMQDLKFGKGGAIQEAAIRYGISVEGKNGLATGEEMLYNIAKRMESLGKSEQLDLGRKLGLDPSTIALLQGGVAGLTKELEKASKYTVYSPEDIENSRKFQMSLRELKQSLAQVWAQISRAILPVFTKIADVLKRLFSFLAEHKGFLLGFLAAVSVALTGIAIKTGIITLPLLKIIAVITGIGTAIGIVADDFMTFLEGGESVIGDLIDAFTDFWLFLFDLGDKIGNFFKGVWDSIISTITGVFDWIVNKWNKLKSWIPFIGGKNKDEQKIVQEGKLAIENTQTPLSTENISNINGGTNNVKIDSVIVQTQATDATGIAQGVGGALSNEMSDVLQQNTGGNLA